MRKILLACAMMALVLPATAGADTTTDLTNALKAYINEQVDARVSDLSSRVSALEAQGAQDGVDIQALKAKTQQLSDDLSGLTSSLKALDGRVTALESPAPPPDTTAPDTSITDHPADGTATNASFSFTSTEPSTFKCSLDGATASSCVSPQGYASLAVGQHTFTVTATDAAGNADQSPASFSWTISASPPPAGACSTTQNVAGGVDPWGGCWPGSSTVGIPAGTNLTAYTGSCTITAANTVIDSKIINCGQLTIQAANVQIKNSRINGYPWIDNQSSPYSFSITDSLVANPSAAQNTESIGKSHFTILRTEITGGRRGVWCEYDCSVTDSYIHGQEHGVLNCTTAGCAWHEAGIRLGSGSSQVLRHNVIACDAPDVDANDPNAPSDTSGCSANLSGYGDFAPIQNNTVDRNLFPPTEGGTCAYGGNTGGGKPYPNGHPNVFTDNVFVRSSTGKCGFWFSSADFNASLSGNTWTGNKLWNGSTLTTLNPNT